MKVDWFTVIAQVVNFLILVWLLKRFLYKPILNAIDKREKKIKSQLEDAEAKIAEAKKEHEEFKQKNDDFDEKKKALMDKAVEESKTQGEMLLEEARNAASALDANLKKVAKETQKNTNIEIARKTQEEVFAISRKVLSDLADVSLEEQSVAVFISRLNAINEDEKSQLLKTFKLDSNSVLIRSAFEVLPAQQTEIKKAVKKILRAKTQFEFKTSPELIIGIELTANGYKLAWNISAYLNAFEKSLYQSADVNPEIETK